jgi:glutaminyl-tRNA synthetase
METVREEEKKPLNFIEEIIEKDLKNGKNQGRVHTRFPPEPNGYLHIGHAKSICLNFGLAKRYGGKTNLRFDDTNPTTEKTDYVDAIRRDVKWLGFEWAEPEFYASDNFDQLYQYALQLIRLGKAYVDHSTAEEMAEMKGTPTQAGKDSPYRNRSVEENLALFEQMRSGSLAEGSCVLRAKIDMASPNMLLRDPIMYRIKKAHHHRTGDKWCIYPMYDWAHGLCDSIEGITHSICTLEFEEHRPLYDWFLEALGVHHPQQIEFARLNLTYTVMSKRKLLKLVESGVVNGWDDPRLPTISGLRRKGYTPAAIRAFAERIGVSKRESMIDLDLLEFCVREDLNKVAPRYMAVLEPIKVVLTNYPEGQEEWLKAENNPEDEQMGERQMPFGRVLYIEQDDFMEVPPKKYHRLAPGQMVRLKHAYIIQCDGVIKDENGKILELRCSYLPNSKSGQDSSGIKVKGTIHWVAAHAAKTVEVRMYDRLMTVADPSEVEDVEFTELINPKSLVVTEALVEPAMMDLAVGERVQFMRKGYFCVDPDSTAERKVFNLTVNLKDSWAKIAAKE